MKPKIRHTLYVVTITILTTTLFMVKCQGNLWAHQIRPIATESEKCVHQEKVSNLEQERI